MIISTVIVTYNRIKLLKRAIISVIKQKRKTDYFYVISNSNDETFKKEIELSKKYNFKLFRNKRTNNYAGALNTSIEEIIKEQFISENIYFASLDDDDEWLPDYLYEIEKANDNNNDLITAYYLRFSPTENVLMKLSHKITEKDFLTGNPGIGGSNTFIRLTTLLKAGAFDEALFASVDRDFFIRVFQLQPKHKIVNKHLVTAHTDKNRKRLTTDKQKKEKSFQVFYYKYKNLMNKEDENKFFDRIRALFSIEKTKINILKENNYTNVVNSISFKNKKDYQFIIGFVAGKTEITDKIINQIIEKNIPVDLVLIIEDVKKKESLDNAIDKLKDNNIEHTIITHNKWKNNLINGYYGTYFKQFTEINSIPLGRTILHHHLYTETKHFNKPVYWIIDDDISFSAVSNTSKNFDLFDLINQYINKVDAIIGSISKDPPIPTLSCMRVQLLDYFYSINSAKLYDDILKIREKTDYYYDLTDKHTNHLETPLFYSANIKSLNKIFSGKGISRPVLQKNFVVSEKTITKRGANTLVFNRDMLKYYPVINLQVNNKFARRGDLLWALFNQVISSRKIIEHSFSIDHNRPIGDFNLEKEINKSAYDIIGYAFNKASIKVINEIKATNKIYRPKDIFENILNEQYFHLFYETFYSYIKHREVRFIINYYRIKGLLNLLELEQYKQFSKNKIEELNNILNTALEQKELKIFLKKLIVAIWSYSKSITDISENETFYKDILQKYFNSKLFILGKGAEGIVFSDNKYVYKIFYNILDKEWEFLKTISLNFKNCKILFNIEMFEYKDYKFIRYPYIQFSKVSEIKIDEIISFFKFCKQNNFVFTNIKPDNFIQGKLGNLKLIDYGKSFEPYDDNKFLNSIKRAFLFLKYPSLTNEKFKEITSLINTGEIPIEIKNWKNLYFSIEPRKKEKILDTEIIKIIKPLNPNRILDYGSGKCKTTKLLKSETDAEIWVYDINTEVLKSRCENFPVYSYKEQKLINYFDIVLLNIVLCEVNTDILHNILKIVFKALKNKGHLIISICNPDFANVKKTEFQNRLNIPVNNETETIINKISNSTKNKRIDYHRPTKQYIKIFEQYGLSLINEIDTYGANIETLEYASDFKIFTLQKDE